MATIERADDRIAIDIEFREGELVKRVPGAKYDYTAQRWFAPLTWATCVSLRGVFGNDLAIGALLSNWAAREHAERITPSLHWRTAMQADVDYLPGLYGYQNASVAFILTAKRALIASEMGCGKTPIAIGALCNLEDALPALVVCPNSVKLTWQRELERWAPHLKTTVFTSAGGKKRDTAVRESDVVIINWEALMRQSKLAGFGSIRLSERDKEPKLLNEREWRTVIADEAHRAKEPTAKQTRALWAVAEPAPYRIALTGTPIANHMGELWSVMHFVSPAEFQSKSRYVDRYALLSWNAFGGMDIMGIRPEMREEFFKILDPRMRRDLKATVLPDLPPKIFQTRVLALEPKQQRAYKQLATEMMTELEDGSILVTTQPLQKALRLWQLASSMLEQDPATGGLLPIDPSNKVDALLEIIDETTYPLVAFAESRKLIELAERRLTKAGVPFMSIHGKISEADRQVALEKFQAGSLPVLLATIKAGGVGLTLTAAHTGVFLQRGDSEVDRVQAIDRLHRVGLDHPVEIIDLVSQGTVEEFQQLQRLAGKAAALQEIVRDADALKMMLELKP